MYQVTLFKNDKVWKHPGHGVRTGARSPTLPAAGPAWLCLLCPRAVGVALEVHTARLLTSGTILLHCRVLARAVDNPDDPH